MKSRYRLIRRSSRGGAFYCVDNITGKRTSLDTTDEEAAKEIIAAKNNAAKQPALNLQLAKAYLAGIDSGISTRTWRAALFSLTETKHGANKERWERVAKDSALSILLDKVIVQTQAELLLKVLSTGTVSTNVFLRRLHNYCLDMNWLPWPILPKRQWPTVRFSEKRGITAEEHQKIIDRERNPERNAFYRLAWHLGASQSDLASLNAEDIDWQNQIITFYRQKTRWRGGTPPQIRFGADVEAVLSSLPKAGPLFPTLKDIHEKHRAAEFRRRCEGLGIKGVTLHSYRYAWAERAKTCGYPERFAQLALGHNSKAVHRAYAKKAQVTIPPLDEYERQYLGSKVIPFSCPAREQQGDPLPATSP